MNSKSRFALPKSHRLRSSLIIQELFKSENSIKEYPLMVHYFWTDEIANHQFMPMVSKRKFKRAVDRNQLKRKLREIWRLNQYKLESAAGGNFLVIGWVYIAKKKLKYSEIERAGLSILNQINHETKKSS